MCGGHGGEQGVEGGDSWTVRDRLCEKTAVVLLIVHVRGLLRVEDRFTEGLRGEDGWSRPASGQRLDLQALAG